MSAEDEACQAALTVTDAFTAAFNARDAAGMDATLHFPHVILSGETMVIWDRPGQLRGDFFDELTRKTGWHHSAYLERRPVLAAPRKVHLLVRYTRNTAMAALSPNTKISGSSRMMADAGASSSAPTERLSFSSPAAAHARAAGHIARCR